MADFKKLQVWQKAHALSLTIDRMCKRIRGAQYSSLRSQLFRAGMSIPANIAEGRSKNSDKDFGRFLGYAISSCSEVEHHLIVARDTKVIPEAEYVPAISQTITVRNNAIRSVEKPFALGANFQNERSRSQEKPAAISRPADSPHQVVISCS
jgi:four helix bundle protein